MLIFLHFVSFQHDLLHLKEEKHICTFFFSIAKVHSTFQGSNLESLVHCFQRYPKLDPRIFS